MTADEWTAFLVIVGVTITAAFIAASLSSGKWRHR